MLLSQSRPPRPGAIAPLTAFLLVPLLGMVAFAVDMGWITHTQNELQSAADAAALAGAGNLPDGFVAYYLPSQTTAAKQATLTASTTKASTAAKAYAGYNSAGGVPSLTLLDGDIEYGYTDAGGTYTAIPAYQGYPNTIKVVMRRDASANTPLGLFFAKVLNINSVDLQATARATIYSGSIDGFGNSSAAMSRILPMTFDVNDWGNFLKYGTNPDGNNNISMNANGQPQIDVYPSLKSRGNFGQLSLDQGNDGASTISNWISNGIAGSDLQAEYTKGLLPFSQHDPLTPPDWKGNPGLKTSTIHTAADNVNGLYLLPLFKPVNADPSAYSAGVGSGSNYYYTIVGFVGVRISAANSSAITVQPSAVIDPNAIYTSTTPAAPPTASSPLVTTFTSPKLTQ